jgi:hypothetical protein
MYLETLDQPQRERVVGRLALAALADTSTGPACLSAAAMAARLWPFADSGPAQDAFLPGYSDFVAGNIVHYDRQQFQAREDLKDPILKLVTENFARPEVSGIRPSGAPYLYVVDRKKGVVRANVEVEMGLRPGASSLAMGPKYTCEGHVTLESEPGPMTPLRAPGWRVIELRLTQGGKPLTPDEMRDVSRGGLQRILQGRGPGDMQQQMEQEKQRALQQRGQ